MRIKTILAAFTLLVTISTPLFSLDTTETFSKGAITEFEAYYTMNSATEGRSHNLELLTGGGFHESFSWLFTTMITMDGNNTEVSGLCFGFTWTVVDNETLAFDLQPNGSMDACCHSGHISYPTMKLWAFGLDTEFNLKAVPGIQPYFRTGIGGNYHTDRDELHWHIPLAVGAMIPLPKKSEFFLQAAWTPEKESPWSGSERTIALGLNVMTRAGLELITELGWEFSNRNLSLGIGLIYAL